MQQQRQPLRKASRPHGEYRHKCGQKPRRQWVAPARGDPDKQRAGWTPIAKASIALSKALEALHVARNDQMSLSVAAESSLRTVQEHLDFAHTTLLRTDRLFDVNTDDIFYTKAEGNVTIGDCDEDDRTFIKSMFFDIHGRPAGGGKFRASCIHQKPFSGKTAAGPRPHVVSAAAGGDGDCEGPAKPLQDGVKTKAASEVAAGWGKEWRFSALDLARMTGACALIFAGCRGAGSWAASPARSGGGAGIDHT